MKKWNVALVGLGFGAGFVEIYKNHPYVGEVGICDADGKRAEEVAEICGISLIYRDLDEILADSGIDAVHLITPIPLHEEQTVKVLEAGKHCACTVPMAISLEGIRRITEAVRQTGKNYMMMETTLYTYQFLYLQQMIEKGEIGRIQFLRGSHYQDMANWPSYWMGLPPMYYGTHAIAPMAALAGARIKRVNCFGSGSMEEWLTRQYGNPFPVESALFEFENGMKGEATRSLFETARTYQEGLFVYGSQGCFEWGFADGDDPYITRQGPVVEGKRGSESRVEVVKMPDFRQYLPEEIQPFTVQGQDSFDPLNPQKSVKKGFTNAGHHGSHPHLVHEFIMSMVENRKPWIDETFGGNITAAGMCAHQSAMAGGVSVEIPLF